MTRYGLGRIKQHDPRSLAFPVASAPVKTITHRHYGAVLDQGQVQSCTGNAMAQSLNTKPLKKTGRTLHERDALALYGRATVLDGFPGTYPPDDSGSSGLAAAKAAQEQGWISGYTHGFGFDATLRGLQSGPAIVGTDWYEDMSTPDPQGFIRPTGRVVGGHEYLLLGLDVRKKRLAFLNSWSSAWGLKGRFYMTFEDFEPLLEADGDALFPTP